MLLIKSDVVTWYVYDTYTYVIPSSSSYLMDSPIYVIFICKIYKIANPECPVTLAKVDSLWHLSQTQVHHRRAHLRKQITLHNESYIRTNLFNLWFMMHDDVLKYDAWHSASCLMMNDTKNDITYVFSFYIMNSYRSEISYLFFCG